MGEFGEDERVLQKSNEQFRAIFHRRRDRLGVLTALAPSWFGVAMPPFLDEQLRSRIHGLRQYFAKRSPVRDKIMFFELFESKIYGSALVWCGHATVP